MRSVFYLQQKEKAAKSDHYLPQHEASK